MMMQQLPSWMNQQPPSPDEQVRMIWIGDLQQWMDKVEPEQVRTLWIGNLEHWMDEAYIDSCFSPTGQVFTIKLFRKYGFIKFKSRAIAEQILHKFHGCTFFPFSLNWVTHGRKKNLWADHILPPPIIPTTTTSIEISQKTGAPKDNSTWEDMLKWWSLSQLDRTCTTRTVHAANRVYEIAAFFQIPFIQSKHIFRDPTETELKKVGALLDELPQYVDSIDIAKEFHSMDALDGLFYYLTIKHGGIPTKVVKVVRTMVHNNPNSQKLVMEAGGDIYLISALFSFVDDPTLETNILDAISSLFKDNTPGITAFRQRNGYAFLIYELDGFCEHSKRKAVKLIHCLLCQHISDCNIVTRLGYHRIMIKMASSYYAEVREAALMCLVFLANFEGDGNSCRLVKNSKQLKRALPELVDGMCATATEHLGAKRQELELLFFLWIACYTKPCPLLEMLLAGLNASKNDLMLGGKL